MSNHLKWAKLGLLSVVLTAAAHGENKPGHDTKGLTIGGSFEGGYTQSFATGVNQSQWIVDNLHVKMSADVSDKVKVVLSNATSVVNATAPAGSAFNTATYYSSAVLAAGNMRFANLGAYIDTKWMDKLSMAVGHMDTPFGMESLWSRYDMHSYYYSAAFSNVRNSAGGLGWAYDLGAKFTLTDMLPGTWEIGIFDGRAGNFDNLSPALALRTWYEWKGGDWTFTPVISTWLGRWHGGPEDIGITAGGMFKSGMLWANLEWVFTQRNTDIQGSQRNRLYSVYIEPGADLGLVNVSLKAEHQRLRAPGATDDTSDWNVAAGLSHTYGEKFRARLVYTHQNLSGNAGTHFNDIRLLFGTKW